MNAETLFQKTVQDTISLICALKESLISYLDFNIQISKYHSVIFELAVKKQKLPTQEAYNFFNLAAELTDAISYADFHPEIPDYALDILINRLNDMYFSDSWTNIAQKRGPVESIDQYSCNDCHFSFPIISFSGFVDYFNACCASCGSILFIHKYDTNFSAVLKNHKENSAKDPYQEFADMLPCCPVDHEQYKFYFAHYLPFEPTHEFCPHCHSQNLNRVPLSRYEYFHKHKYFYLKFGAFEIEDK